MNHRIHPALLVMIVLATSCGGEEEPGGSGGSDRSGDSPSNTMIPTSLIAACDFESEERGTRLLGGANRAEALARTRLVSAPVRVGRRALEVNLRRDGVAHRTDFYITNIGGRFKVGREYWFGFSTWIPEDWKPDNQNELFVQWVRTTKKIAGPQLAIYVNGENYVLRKRWDPDPAGPKSTVRYVNLWRGSVIPDRGRWVDWAVHVKWSEKEDGFVRLWRNRKPIVRDAGPNCYTAGDGKAPYFKFGIYKWPWAKSEEDAPSVVSARTIYFDEIRIGASDADLDAVSPPDR